MLSNHHFQIEIMFPDKNMYKLRLSNTLAINKSSKLPLDNAMQSPRHIKWRKHNSPALQSRIIPNHKRLLGAGSKAPSLFHTPILLFWGTTRPLPSWGWNVSGGSLAGEAHLTHHSPAPACLRKWYSYLGDFEIIQLKFKANIANPENQVCATLSVLL